ncbi:MAG: hypothetical protein E6J45_14665, partial [Chloroflexi bacterium]
ITTARAFPRSVSKFRPYSPTEWAREINMLFASTVRAFVDTGAKLRESKARLGHGAWGSMFRGHPRAVAEPLHFSERTARMLMAIAKHPIISNRNHGSDLPCSWRTLYLLSRLDDQVLLQALADGGITPDMSRNAVKGLQRLARFGATDAAARRVVEGLDSRILVGDFRTVGGNVPDGSTALIVTDLPYDQVGSAMLPDLAAFAERVLAPGGSLLTYIGQTQMPVAMAALSSSGLRYWWTIGCFHAAHADGWTPAVLMPEHGIKCAWKAVLWFVKGTRRDPSVLVTDVVSGGREKTHHPWQQAESEAACWIDKLCPSDGLVVDPFLGSGTTACAAIRLGRKWVGIELDPATAAAASERIARCEAVDGSRGPARCG